MAKAGGRKYTRDKNGKFASSGGGSGPKLGSKRPGTSAPQGTVAKSAVNRTLGATRGQGKASKAPAPAVASGGKRRGVKLGGNRPGTSAPQGTVAKGSVNRSLGAVRGYGKGSKAAAPAAKPKQSVADRKKALIRDTSNQALAGKKVSKSRMGYVRAQQAESQRLANRGKGNKAARRMKKA